MERLSDTVIEIVNELHRERLDYKSEYVPLIDALNRLAAYEDTGLEPQTISEILDSVSEWYDAHKEGRLLVLPCKVGEKFYYNFLGKTYEGKLTKVVYHEAGVQVYFADYDGDNASRRLNEVFKTREEAEAKLKEREGT